MFRDFTQKFFPELIFKWFKLLDTIINGHNNKIHSSLQGMSPSEIMLENQNEVFPE